MATPTISAVARHAGVSVASVSRVMNGMSARPKTEKLVKAAIAELGYQPNSAARALKVRESDQICLSFADLGNPAYVSMTRGVGRVLRDSKYRLLLSSSFSSVGEIIEQLKSMGRGYADGLIISPIYSDPEITELIARLKIPVVLIGTAPEGLKVDNVHIDSSVGIKMAVTHLRDRGRKRIGLLNGPLNTNPGYRRSEGFKRIINSLKLSIDTEQIILAEDFSSHGAYKVLAKTTHLREFDALVCGNDLMAAGALKFLFEVGISVPDKMAIVGIDNTELGSLIRPTLTSVDLLAEKRGELAAELLLDRIKNPDFAPRKVLVKPELIVRASS